MKEGKIDFLKTKDEANQSVKNHFIWLKVLGQQPKALQIDHGKEFNNTNLVNWCKKEGMEIQFTAPYSLSQNSVAV